MSRSEIDVYQKLASLLPERTILATNSSTLLPSQFAEATGRPGKYCALHFANLIWSMNVAEVMPHSGTSEETVTEITRFAIEIGMVPVPIGKEQNGYVVNTLLLPLLNAARKGETHEKVHDVVWAGDRRVRRGRKLPPVGSTVDVVNANWTNTIGASELGTVWTDPDFDRRQKAFYYARVIEIPTPRWSTYDAFRLGVPLPKGAPTSTQERAYTSPIWYDPR